MDFLLTIWYTYTGYLKTQRIYKEYISAVFNI